MASGPPALLLFGTSDSTPDLRLRLNGELNSHLLMRQDLTCMQANLPNLRRLFVEARTEAEENEYSRTAFYNLVLFISSVAVFSLVAQRMSGPKAGR
ncbi:hypothetical protein PENARI_c020G12262 [Penicillium arizonense]|uniref:Uncharacterized protein n=1 Tax=Penicillium arizonense TaxID=1835702 RepID=A0A1F5L8R6_PENAI|nr:hypothetical protein PENARI_c020G12262 [Penicillium arizonense]OGE49613.1 hypothetical protein PENARI_c020G12262 [Penicillium arizonense]